MNEQIVKKRKRRSDRNHLIYMLVNEHTGERYVGLTVIAGRQVKVALRDRWNKHVQRALEQGKSWTLCESIRTWGPEAFTQHIVEIVRGKAQAHARETELKKQLKTELNTA